MKPVSVIGIGDDGCRSLSPFNAVQEATRIAAGGLASGRKRSLAALNSAQKAARTAGGSWAFGHKPSLTALNSAKEATRIAAGGLASGRKPSLAAGLRPSLGDTADGCRSLSPFNAVQEATQIAGGSRNPDFFADLPGAPLAGGSWASGRKPSLTAFNAVHVVTRTVTGGQGQSPSPAGGTKS